MKKLSFIIVVLSTVISISSSAQNETVNGVLTVNTSGVNTIRVENNVAGEEATIRLRSKPNNGSGWLHADIAAYASGSNTGFLGFKVPHDNTFGSGFNMVINHSGYVGIGTTNPLSKLSIQGDGSTTGSAVINFKHSGNGMSIGLGTTSNNFIIGNSWNPESGTYLTIQDGTGKIGIGTADFTGNHKLRVEGSIGAREMKVETSGWSDFVFENDYDLRTLEEVEEHINENGHLPEIPNEAEVTENGINLGEMNAKLLQKIEELTLYLIEQNKQLEKANQNITELQEKVSILENE